MLTNPATISSVVPENICPLPRGAGVNTFATWVGDPFKPSCVKSASMSLCVQQVIFACLERIIPLSEGTLGVLISFTTVKNLPRSTRRASAPKTPTAPAAPFRRRLRHIWPKAKASTAQSRWPRNISRARFSRVFQSAPVIVRCITSIDSGKTSFRLGNNRAPFVMPANAGIQVMDSVRHTVEKRYPVIGLGMDPGFHRGDDIAWIPACTGMTEGPC